MEHLAPLDPPAALDAPTALDPPAPVNDALARLWQAGHAAYLVGGGVRDELLGRPVVDWDVATDARPERILELFPAGHYENRFGTVTVPAAELELEVTTFRREHRYADHRRPDEVTFSDSLEEDLARRDFTVNAIAWGRPGGADASDEPHWADPTGGLADLRAGRLRAVGDPALRFDEDALRLLRAARLAAQLGFEIEPATRAAMAATAETVRWVSSERIGDELRKMIAADPPSTGMAILADTGVLEHALPELAAQRGVAQDKVEGLDLWAHCLAALDAAARLDPLNATLRLAALLHDIGKPGTLADGHFIGHDEEGARLAAGLLTRLAFPRREVDRVVHLVRGHMFSYERRWRGAAVRRFIRRVGRELVADQLMLRAADNVGSGLAPDAGHLDELRRRAAAELAAGAPLSLRELAVRGDDLVGELELAPGPIVGELLEHLLRGVISDPARNDRAALLAEARAWLVKRTAGQAGQAGGS
jgi:tRNA nucleotidyltransferase/poly(A) polymerase